MSAPVAVTAALHGLQLIEASAGTGKTWTIAGLFLRLVVERGLAVDQILVMSFTRAATAELRERIRARLQQLALASAADADPALRGALQASDPVAAALLQRWPAALCQQRAVAALRNFDSAAILTLHGFCQRALSDRALSTGIRFQTELSQDVEPWLNELVEDHWRRQIAQPAAGSLAAHPWFVDWLLRKKHSPQRLLQWLRPLLAQAELQLLWPEPVDSLALLDAQQGLPAQLAALAAQWPQAREACRVLMSTPAINKTRYRAGSFDKRFALIEDWLRSGSPSAAPDELKYFTSDHLRSAKAPEPYPPIIAVCDRVATDCQTLRRAIEAHWQQLRLQLLESVRQQLPARMQADGQQSFDSLLIHLHQALHGAQAEALAQALRQRHPAALIDEFQDTDSRQWQILQRIYVDHDQTDGSGNSPCLFLVGDPKQAIYSFRGADVQAYLQAVEHCAQRHTLSENQRSVPQLIHALNLLYLRHPQPFRLAGIGYPEVRPSPRERPPLIDSRADSPAALYLIDDVAGTEADDAGIDEVRSAAAERCATEIAALLAAAAQGQLQIGERALRADDIAVLVGTHDQGRRVQQALAALGIPSAQQSPDSVLQCREADQLRVLLLALLNPSHDGLLRGALSTALFGLDAAALIALDADPDAQLQQIERFAQWLDSWRQHGFARMFQRLLVEAGIGERLASYVDGERRLTNLLHLGELLHAREHQHPGPEALLQWLEQQRAGDRVDSAELRLESDATLVQILTIHRAKGLEFPICFVPYLWDQRRASSPDDIVLYHAAEAPQPLCLDARHSHREMATERAAEERQAEALRLAYVALTRARYRVYVQLSRRFDALDSSLSWLLGGGHGDTLCIAAERERLKKPEKQARAAQHWQQQLEAILHAAEGHIRLLPAAATTVSGRPMQTPPPPLAARPPPPLPKPRITRSFTALSKLGVAADEPGADHDQDWSAPVPIAPAAADADIAHRFPRGAEAGVCLHAMFERLDFADSSSWPAPVERALQAAGLGALQGETGAVIEWLDRVVHTPLLDDGLCLAQLPRQQQLRELGFQLPMSQFSAQALTAALRAEGWPASPLLATRDSGYLKGYIDLVFRHPHSGQYWVLDYKSNALGADTAAYHPAALAQSMADSDYPLQAALYLLAVHRLLRQRLRDYRPERDLGGALYLYLRGMDGRPRHGVQALPLSIGLLQRLDALFPAGDTGAAS